MNPISGKGNAVKIMKSIQWNDFHTHFVITEKNTSVEDIKRNVFSAKAQMVVAIGGDGTVNMVATALKNSDIPMGIIPCGSGNGLARSLGYSMLPQKALKQILNSPIKKIDAGRVNGFYFYCTSGFGFDASVAHAFAKLNKRGLMNYVRLVIQQIFSFNHFYVHSDAVAVTKKYFMFTIGNAPQFGNDFYIVPQSVLNDGKIDICALSSFSAFQIPSLLLKIFMKKVYEHSACQYFKTESFNLEADRELPLHTDGEPAGFHKQFHFSVEPQCVSVIVPDGKYFLS
ncbi:MAG: diacylglycerol kinase family lipid kinase [Bacteroidia bacterium]|nr:diacylglycerol kinase family lipid kinase [Bacteroidia bacterium]